MILDGAKDAAKNAFKASLLPLIGAAVVYFLIKGYQKVKR